MPPSRQQTPRRKIRKRLQRKKKNQNLSVFQQTAKANLETRAPLLQCMSPLFGSDKGKLTMSVYEGRTDFAGAAFDF